MGKSIEEIHHQGKILAVVSRSSLVQELKSEHTPLAFVTPPAFPFQVGIHQRKQGEMIAAHFHIPFPQLENFPVQEFFYVISGKLQVDLYEPYDAQNGDRKVAEVVLHKGDTITLNTGHGFRFLEDTELVELKQGPYRGKEQEKRYVRSKQHEPGEHREQSEHQGTK